MMAKAKSGLIVHITSALEPGKADNVAYGASRAAINAMAADMGRELAPQGVAVVALAPSYVATEMLRAGRSPEWILPSLETPHFVGNAVVALATDANVLRQSGKVLGTRRLAQEYGFTDLNGHMPRE
jgi:dehydrogenase/reductase SDR family protein 1